MTCAHVVAMALDREVELIDCAEAPTDDIILDLPIAERDFLKARVLPSKWRPRRSQSAGGGIDDAAVLELLPGHELPLGSKAVGKTRAVSDDDWMRGYGVSLNEPDGVIIRGRFQGAFSNRFHFIAEAMDEAVRPGCSGTAAWNEKARGIAGMVVEMQQNNVGRVIRVDLLNELWPISWEDELESESAERPARVQVGSSLVPRLAAQLRYVDRQEQVGRFEGLLAAHWDRTRTPLICTIAGLESDKPDWCRDRCRASGLDKRFKRLKIPTGRVDMIEIAWPSETTFDHDFEFAGLLNSARAFLDPRKDTPEEFRVAYNRMLNPVVFYSSFEEPVIRAGRDAHLRLLRAWIDFWTSVGAKPLKKPFVHFLLLTLDDASAVGTGAQQFHQQLLADAGIDQMHRLPLLRAFKRDEIDVWLRNIADDVRLSKARLIDLQARARELFKTRPSPRLADLEEWVEQLSV